MASIKTRMIANGRADMIMGRLRTSSCPALTVERGSQPEPSSVILQANATILLAPAMGSGIYYRTAKQGDRSAHASEQQTGVPRLKPVEGTSVENAGGALSLDTAAARPERETVGHVGRPWLRLGLPAAAIVAVLAALYWQVLWAQALDWWNDPNYSHAFLVPLFSGL